MTFKKKKRILFSTSNYAFKTWVVKYITYFLKLTGGNEVELKGTDPISNNLWENAVYGMRWPTDLHINS